MHDQFIFWIMSDAASIFLAAVSFFLMFLYIFQFFLSVDVFIVSKNLRRNRLLMRALNWAIFGAVFLLFGRVFGENRLLQDVLTWRATARVALLFLMLPEIAYQLTVLYPKIKEVVWTKILHQ